MKQSQRFLLAGAAILLAPQLAFAAACPDTAYNVNVSEFSSSTPLNPPTIYPIGGSGIGNGAFSRCNHPGVQVGLRISERFVGSIIPTGKTYISPQGAAGDGNAKWNIEGHFDSGYQYGNGTYPDQLGDVTVMMQIDCDPAMGVVNGPMVDIGGVGTSDQAILVQTSENLGFPLRCGGSYPVFDPAADGSYEFSVTVTDKTTGDIIAEAQATALVGNPPLPDSKVNAVGLVESSAGGFKFPDGTVQTTAATVKVYITTEILPAGAATALCNPGDTILGGGGTCGETNSIRTSCPSDINGICGTTGSIQGWTVACTGTATATAYALCTTK